jgi:ribosome-associated toxin RatA of RatAB toxin-antitoxin module
MHVSNTILIDAPAQRIFERASATPRWPEMLPHYRWVRVLERSGERSVLEMAAVRPFGKTGMTIPVRWRAEQINDAALPQIFFRHLGGWTKGMRVYWRFEPLGGKTLVRIDHELRSPLAPIIGKYFIDPIATRTLARMKELCEQS